MNFSDKIKYQREQNHLTQKELAELVGVSQRAIAAYESSGTIARISTMRKLAHALNVSYDYLKHDEITDPSYGIEKMDYIDEVNGQLGEKGARDINEILEANRALFAGGELDEEAKDAFYQAVTKAYLGGLYHWHKSGVHYVITLYKADKFTGELKSSEEGRVYWIPLEELKTKELATGMEHVLQILESELVDECYMHLEADGYVGDLY